MMNDPRSRNDDPNARSDLVPEPPPPDRGLAAMLASLIERFVSDFPANDGFSGFFVRVKLKAEMCA
jgi:hypothetical protein